ncbi:MAG: cobyrinate a,c-diamide synthase [Bacteroidota bacterium]
MADQVKHQLVICAPSSNSGKTTVTLGLLRAFQKRGLQVQPFKCGPDYIDPKFHEMACGRPSINLDSIMMPEPHLKDSYSKYAQKADVTVLEGVMGLFDGAIKSTGSTASLAKLLHLPVILVVDAKATAFSVAPLIYGFKHFDPALQLAGVIFNRVSSTTHYQLLQEACEAIDVPTFGYVPFVKDCEIPSRHLGLSLKDLNAFSPSVDVLAEKMEATVALDQLLDAVNLPFADQSTSTDLSTPNGSFSAKPYSAKYHPTESYSAKSCPTESYPTKPLKVAVARDEAFNFTYTQSIEKLKSRGSISFFSPLHDQQLPKADLLYFPGGYPELHAKALAENEAMKAAISRFLADNGKAFAECGGLMYLSKKLTDKEGHDFEMVGALDFSTSMESMKLSLGYRKIQWEGNELRGHEFHYSVGEELGEMNSLGRVTNIRDREVQTKLYLTTNILASYIHLYFGDDETLDRMMSLLNL